MKRINIFARCVVIYGALNVLLAVAYPWVVRLAMHFRFTRFLHLRDGTAGGLWQRMMASPSMWITLSLLIGVAGIVSGRGILQRKEWARWTWLCACMVHPFVDVLSILITDEATGSNVYTLAFIGIAVVSAWVLMSHEAEVEFTGRTLPPSPGVGKA